jgi:hypothetical protein
MVNPAAIDFYYPVGLNYVSCSPFPASPVRLAGARAVINNAK